MIDVQYSTLSPFVVSSGSAFPCLAAPPPPPPCGTISLWMKNFALFLGITPRRGLVEGLESRRKQDDALLRILRSRHGLMVLRMPVGRVLPPEDRSSAPPVRRRPPLVINISGDGEGPRFAHHLLFWLKKYTNNAKNLHQSPSFRSASRHPLKAPTLLPAPPPPPPRSPEPGQRRDL